MADRPKDTRSELQERIKRTANRARIQHWRYMNEILKGNFAVYKDRTSGTVKNLMAGEFIPDFGDRVKKDLITYPDPHIITIANGVDGRAKANPLIPRVRPVTTDDEDKDAAKAATQFLMALDYEQESRYKIRDKIMQWLKPCGVFFAKVYWDVNIGEYALNPMTGLPLEGPNGQLLRTGDIALNFPLPQAMRLPTGVSYFEQIPYIGEEVAMDVDYIYKKYNIKVDPEENLHDITTLTADPMYGDVSGVLENHRRVWEFYDPPSDKYPYGRHRILIDNEVVEDVYDRALIEAYSDPEMGEWHPYIMCCYLKQAGEIWPKSLFDYLVGHQLLLNRLNTIMGVSNRFINGWFDAAKNSVEWRKVRLQGMQEDIPLLEWDPAKAQGYSPKYNPPPVINVQANQMAQHVIYRMNDIAAYYESTRGGSDPNVTSGKQAQLLQQANMTHANPLLLNIAAFQVRLWEKELRLASVHLAGERIIRYVGENNEVISGTIRPEQIKSDDVTVDNLSTFLMTPEAKQQQMEKMMALGVLGDMSDPVVRKKFADTYQIGDIDSFYEGFTADFDMAKYENKLFMNGNFNETDQVIIDRIQAEHQAAIQAWQLETQTYPERLQEWELAKAQRENALAKLRLERLAVGDKKLDMPSEEVFLPPDPGPPPERPSPNAPPAPPMYRRAREEDDDDVHIYAHMLQMKKLEFEKRCQEMPETRMVFEFHIQDHRQNKARKAQNMQAISAPVQQQAAAIQADVQRQILQQQPQPQQGGGPAQ